MSKTNRINKILAMVMGVCASMPFEVGAAKKSKKGLKKPSVSSVIKPIFPRKVTVRNPGAKLSKPIFKSEQGGLGNKGKVSHGVKDFLINQGRNVKGFFIDKDGRPTKRGLYCGIPVIVTFVAGVGWCVKRGVTGTWFGKGEQQHQNPNTNLNNNIQNNQNIEQNNQGNQNTEQNNQGNQNTEQNNQGNQNTEQNNDSMDIKNMNINEEINNRSNEENANINNIDNQNNQNNNIQNNNQNENNIKNLNINNPSQKMDGNNFQNNEKNANINNIDNQNNQNNQNNNIQNNNQNENNIKNLNTNNPSQSMDGNNFQNNEKNANINNIDNQNNRVPGKYSALINDGKNLVYLIDGGHVSLCKGKTNGTLIREFKVIEVGDWDFKGNRCKLAKEVFVNKYHAGDWVVKALFGD